MKFVLLSLLVSAAFAAQCESPKYSESGYSTTDGFFHYHTTYIVDFALQCSNNVRDPTLYAVINGKVNQAAISEETARYQVSWSLPNEQSAAQTFSINLYDEEQYEKYLKAYNNGDASSVSPSFTIDYYHPGVSRSWPLSSETAALLIAFVAIYYAFSARSELKA